MTPSRPKPTTLAALVLTALAGCEAPGADEVDAGLPEALGVAVQTIHDGHAGDPPWPHVLTRYGGPDDPSAYGHNTSCGPVADGSWWYATERAAFYCGARLELRRDDKCVVVDVQDNGPADWVEERSAAQCGTG